MGRVSGNRSEWQEQRKKKLWKMGEVVRRKMKRNGKRKRKQKKKKSDECLENTNITNITHIFLFLLRKAVVAPDPENDVQGHPAHARVLERSTASAAIFSFNH